MNCQDKKAKFNWTEEQYNKCLQKEQLETPPNQELNPLTGLGLEVDIDIDEAIKNTPEKKPELSEITPFIKFCFFNWIIFTEEYFISIVFCLNYSICNW